MATIPLISQVIIESNLEWQKPLIRDVVCELVDINKSFPLIDTLLIEWEESVVSSGFNYLFMFGEI